MEELKKTGIAHHAYCLADLDAEPALLGTISDILGIDTNGNPDISIYRFQNLLAEEARDLVLAASYLPVSGDKKFFIITAHSMTEQAQNALLKALEESPGRTVFFLLVPDTNILLATLRSRLNIIKTRTANKEQQYEKTFLEKSIPKRLEYVKKITAQAAEEESKLGAFAFLSSVETEAYEKFKKEPREYLTALEETARTRSNLNLQGASVKLLLEHLAITLP